MAKTRPVDLQELSSQRPESSSTKVVLTAITERSTMLVQCNNQGKALLSHALIMAFITTVLTLL